MSEELTPKEISKLIKSSGFKSKAEFARKMGLNVVTVNSWGLKNPAPVYLMQVLEWAKKARLYDKRRLETCLIIVKIKICSYVRCSCIAFLSPRKDNFFNDHTMHLIVRSA